MSRADGSLQYSSQSDKGLMVRIRAAFKDVISQGVLIRDYR